MNEDEDVRTTAETRNEGDRGGNDGDDGPKTPKKAKARREAARRAISERR